MDTSRFEEYCNYLWTIARASLGPTLEGKVEASDLVQLTFVRALQAQDQKQSSDISTVAAWLRQVLRTVVMDELKRYSRGKRDAALEQSLFENIDHSAAGFEHWLAADWTSPSMAAMNEERLLKLSDALLNCLPISETSSS